MKEQALKIVSDLIDDHKIKGEDAVTLIIAISDNSPRQYASAAPIISQPIRPEDISRPQCELTDVVINPHTSNPYPDTITTTVTGNITNDIITTSPKGMEIIYG